MASALPETERQRYEQAIVHFQNELAGSKPPGFIGATSFQIEAVLWLSDLPGYEDWYLLDGTWAMDPLAISGHVHSSASGAANGISASTNERRADIKISN